VRALIKTLCGKLRAPPNPLLPQTECDYLYNVGGSGRLWVGNRVLARATCNS